MTNTLARTAAKRARLSIILAFSAVGFLLAVWLVHIPEAQARTGVSHQVLGFTLLALGAGSFIAMQLAGYFVSRIGARPVVVGGVAVMALTLLFPAFAWDAWSLSVALFFFGVGNGLCEVAMNAEAVEIEIDLGRPVMSSFHAMFSVGTAVGAGVGGVLQATSLSIELSFTLVTVIGLGLATAILVLLPPRPISRFGGREPEAEGSGTNRSLRLRIVILGTLAFLLMLAEGVANDWSALHAIEQLSVDTSAAAFTYGTFAVAMTIGRLTVDRIVAAFGPVYVVRVGSLVAAAGLLLVTLSPNFALVLTGWAIFALGLSGIVPQIFTSAGNLPVANRQVILSRIVGAGYIGLLAGPAIVGWLAESWTLNLALIAPLIMCVFGAIAASVVRPSPTRKTEE